MGIRHLSSHIFSHWIFQVYQPLQSYLPPSLLQPECFFPKLKLVTSLPGLKPIKIYPLSVGCKAYTVVRCTWSCRLGPVKTSLDFSLPTHCSLVTQRICHSIGCQRLLLLQASGPSALLWGTSNSSPLPVLPVKGHHLPRPNSSFASSMESSLTSFPSSKPTFHRQGSLLPYQYICYCLSITQTKETVQRIVWSSFYTFSNLTSPP